MNLLISSAAVGVYFMPTVGSSIVKQSLALLVCESVYFKQEYLLDMLVGTIQNDNDFDVFLFFFSNFVSFQLNRLSHYKSLDTCLANCPPVFLLPWRWTILAIHFRAMPGNTFLPVACTFCVFCSILIFCNCGHNIVCEH